MEEAESILVEKAAAGDQAAFERLMEAHKDMVYTLCVRTLGNAHDAEEVFQDAFLSAYRNLSGFRGDSKVSTWLYRIALNRCRDFMESRKSRQARETVSIDALERPLAAASSDDAFDAKSILEQAMPLHEDPLTAPGTSRSVQRTPTRRVTVTEYALVEPSSAYTL